jgi:hypothetical protein
MVGQLLLTEFQVLLQTEGKEMGSYVLSELLENWGADRVSVDYLSEESRSRKVRCHIKASLIDVRSREL